VRSQGPNTTRSVLDGALFLVCHIASSDFLFASGDPFASGTSASNVPLASASSCSCLLAPKANSPFQSP